MSKYYLIKINRDLHPEVDGEIHLTIDNVMGSNEDIIELTKEELELIIDMNWIEMTTNKKTRGLWKNPKRDLHCKIRKVLDNE